MDAEFIAAGIKVCPSHTVGLQCAACRQCDGTDKGARRPSFYIPLHGIKGSQVRRAADGV